MSVVKPLLPPKPADKLLIKECFGRLKDIGILSEQKSIELCESVNGVLNNETPTITDSMKVLHDLEYIYFNDPALLEEIYKSMSNKNFCFLHQIFLFIDTQLIYMYQHTGYQTRSMTLFKPAIYYKEQIINCDSDIFAIPIGFKIDLSPHANMLIVKRIRNPITQVLQSIKVEHFEPHGALFNYNEIKTKKIGDMISILIHTLFEREKIPINIFTPEMICPRPNSALQAMVSGDWGGTCAIFSMWYAFKRLTEPEKDAKVVYAEMFKVFDKKSPIEIIKAITHSFVKLVNIDLDKNMINRREIHSQKIKEIKLGRIIKQLEDKTYSSNEINISDTVEDELIIKLLNALKTNETVRTLTISDNYNVNFLEKIYELFTTNKTIITLGLLNNTSTDYFKTLNMFYLFDALQYNKTIKNLNITHNLITFNFSIKEIHDLSDIFTKLSLKTIDISYNLINNDHSLKYLLRYNTSLHILNLSNNEMGDIGTIELANGLNSNTTLLEINLSNNNIGDKGLNVLATVLKVNKSIIDLNLSNNNIGDKGVFELMEVLPFNRRIEFNLSNNKLIILKNVVHAYKSLRDIDRIVFNTNLENDLLNLLELLRVNTTIKSLYIYDCNITEKILIEITNLLKINTSLLEIELSENDLENKEVIALTEGLKYNKSLKIFNLSYNKIGYEGTVALIDILKINELLTIYLTHNNMKYNELFKLHKELKKDISIQNRLIINPLIKPYIPLKQPIGLQHEALSSSNKYKSIYEKKYLKYKNKYLSLRSKHNYL
jgi:hypothetical protein